MAITVKFYSFSKKENSTAIPTGGTSFDCTIKDSSSIFFPIIKLNRGAATSAAPAFNYCYISDFGRYYWITNWSWELGIWEASLKCDVLATYKSSIGSASLYALRASNSNDGAIVDNLYPTKTGCSFSQSTGWNFSGSGGFGASYIMGVVSKDPDFGSICYYAMNSSNLGTVIQELLNDSLLTNNGFSAADASLALQKSLVDPMQFIKSCVYLPFTLSELSNLSTSASAVNIFDWTLTATAKTVRPPTPVTTVTHSFTLPKHPQTSARGKYVNQAPYTYLSLVAPPFGVIDLDATAFVDATTVDIELKVDMPTGLGILTISNGSQVINRLEAQIGVPIQLSQVSRDYVGATLGAVGGVLSGVGSAMTGNWVGLAGGIASGIGSAVDGLKPKSQSVGSGGSYAQVRGSWFVEAQFFTIVDDDNAHNGRPLCQMVTPSALSGYMLIQDGDVAISGTQEEAAEVKRYLETGFFYE